MGAVVGPAIAMLLLQLHSGNYQMVFWGKNDSLDWSVL
jgi:hypothetical protein